MAGDGGARRGAIAQERSVRNAFVSIPGGRAEVGTDRPFFPADGEGPRRSVSVAPFALDAVAVTNDRFAAFVEATAYVTDAERFGWSFVFCQHVAGDADALARVPGATWWRRVDGALWRCPEGPGSDIADRLDHPVVHVSHNDAVAFASWSGGRLPSESEWEHAARGGIRGAEFPWGDVEPTDDGPYPCNIWQGTFPARNTAADGFGGTAPARSFAPNGYGLYNMCGNVWEWCADRFRVRSLARAARALNEVSAREKRVVQKGGSFLCHKSYCFRYRIAARVGNTPDTSTSHVGFRVAYDP
jgi:formylglycine-generating enzyme required for sulfatase activity